MSDRFDVVVVGAGSAGSSAAITAARHGARTLLLDRLAFMGGTSTAVLDTFYAFYTPGREPAPGRRRARLGGREPPDRRRRGVRAPEHLRRGHRGDVRRRGAQGRLGAAGRGRGRRAAAAHLGHGRPARRRPAAPGGPAVEQGRRALDRGVGVRRRVRRRRRVRDGRGRVRRREHHAGGRPVAVDAVQARQRGRRARDGGAQGGAVGADAGGRRARRLPAAAGRGLVAPDAVPGRGPDPHDPDPQRRRDRSRRSSRGPRSRAGARCRSTTASCTIASRASSGR